MVEMKIKKQLNLSQLIEWAWENNITNQEFFCDGFKEKSVIFNLSGWAEFSDEFSYIPHDTFTVEVEEEVNGETILDRLYEVYFDGLTHDTNIFTNTTTNSLITSKTELIYTVIDNQVIVLWEKYAGGFR